MSKVLKIEPENVHNTLSQHMLVDGFHLVMDLEKSHGSWIFDATRQTEILDGYPLFSAFQKKKTFLNQIHIRVLLPCLLDITTQNYLKMLF